MLTPGQWEYYANIVNQASESFNSEVLLWNRAAFKESLLGGDTDPTKTTVALPVLIEFNRNRTWPSTQYTDTGEIDQQTLVVFINRKWLQDNELLTAQGYLDFNADDDTFIHRGILYKSEGDTLMSQGYNNPLFMYLVLRRQRTRTGTDIYAQ